MANGWRKAQTGAWAGIGIRLRWCGVLALLGLASSVHAGAEGAKASGNALACSDDLTAALHKEMDASLASTDLFACGINAAAPNEVILAYATTAPGAKPDSDGNTAKKLTVRVLDAGTWNDLASFDDPEELEDDGSRLEGIAIETKRYRLAPGANAFGVRAHHSLHCYQCLYNEESVTLYVRNGKAIRKVLPASQVSLEAFQDPRHCPQSYATITSVLSPATTSHNGFADLLVTVKTDVKIDEEDMEPLYPGGPTRNAANCPKHVATEQQALRFNGDHYPRLMAVSHNP
jgi:hypothetical protein